MRANPSTGHAAREPFIFNGAREMAEILSREVDGRERERERSCVALIEAGEKQVYENRKRYCNRARKLPKRDESSSFSRDVFSHETIDGILRNTENRSPSKDEYSYFSEGRNICCFECINQMYRSCEELAKKKR